MCIEFCVHVAAASCDRSASLSSHDRTHFSDTSRVGVFTQFRALASDVDDLHRSYSGTWFQLVGRSYRRAGQRLLAPPQVTTSPCASAGGKPPGGFGLLTVGPLFGPASAPGPTLGTCRHDCPNRTGPASLSVVGGRFWPSIDVADRGGPATTLMSAPSFPLRADVLCCAVFMTPIVEHPLWNTPQ